MGLVYEQKGRYYISNNQKPDIISHIIKIGSLLIPRMLFYGIFFLIISFYFILRLLIFGFTLVDLFALIALIISASILFIIEAILSYKRLF
jgi:hypothetical protein